MATWILKSNDNGAALGQYMKIVGSGYSFIKKKLNSGFSVRSDSIQGPISI